MVKLSIIAYFSLLLLQSAVCQDNSIENSIGLSIAFSKDTVSFQDSLEIQLSFKNTSDSVVSLNPIAIIGISHYHPDVFITYAAERVLYSLNNYCSPKDKVEILPKGFYTKTYDIGVDSSFFYSGENVLWALYHYHSSSKSKQVFRKRKQNRNILSFCSPEVRLFVTPSE